MSRLVIFLALATLLAAPASSTRAADPPKCKLVRIAEWPVRLQRNLPIVDGTINGNKVGILLDTGSMASVVTTATAEKLNLPMEASGQRMLGVGGIARVYMTRIDELRMGDAVRKNLRVRVTGERPIPGVDFILGDDFFRQVDVEFDYAKGVVRLFQPVECGNAWLAYWDADALQIPMENERNKIVFTVAINGRPTRALLDSGASGSVVSLPFAATLGITPQTQGVVESGCSRGVGANVVHAWVARFDSVSIGGETIRDARLRISDFMPEVAYGASVNHEMLVGTDFLRAHRVLVAHSQQKIYFSHSGGIVFPTTPALACDDRPTDPTAALASYEETLGRDPNNVRALIGRALLRSGANDRQGALADLDVAIRANPDNAVALDARARVRAALGDYEGALADSEAAINNGMRNADIYVRRGDMRRAQGDQARAIEEYDEALKLEPTHERARAARARSVDEATKKAK